MSLLVGDLSYADGTQPVWNSFGHVISPAASVLPFLWGLGNHEWFDFEDYSFVSYTKRMRIPVAVQGDATCLWYSYDIGLVHFVMLQGYCPQMRSTATQPCLAGTASATVTAISAGLRGEWKPLELAKSVRLVVRREPVRAQLMDANM